MFVRAVILRLQVPDQRYIVIRAVARRDVAWAKELTKQMLNREKDDRDSAADQLRDQLAAERLLQTAHEMISTDVNREDRLRYLTVISGLQD